MIIDSHCHAWSYWPYLPEPAHPEQHGSIETLIHQMDQNGVDKATIVCAQIYRNKTNNDYISNALSNYPNRLEQFADVDSFWSETYHIKGAANRLEVAIEKWPMKAFTHYLANEDDGKWMNSKHGIDFFNVAEEAKIIASLAVAPHHQNEIRKVAERHPNLKILCHHMSGLKSYGNDKDKNLKEDALGLITKADRYNWIHQTSWFGEPIINLPQEGKDFLDKYYNINKKIRKI